MSRIPCTLSKVLQALDAHAFEFLIAILAVLLGALQLVRGDVSGAMRTLLGDGLLITLWGLYLAAGGVCVLVGLLMRWPSILDRGFSVERVGLGALQVGFLAYAIALLAVHGSGAIATAGAMLVTSIACWRRSAFLTKQRAELKAARAKLLTGGRFDA